jgi:hypothetical protein
MPVSWFICASGFMVLASIGSICLSLSLSMLRKRVDKLEKIIKDAGLWREG